MTTFEIIKKLAKQHDKSLQQVAEDLNFSKNLFYRWKTSDPKAKDLAKVADYFGVSTDYLLGRSDDKYDLSPQEKIDIGIEAEKMMKGLNDEGSINFYGEPMSEEDKEATLAALNLLMTINRKKAKKKKDMN